MKTIPLKLFLILFTVILLTSCKNRMPVSTGQDQPRTVPIVKNDQDLQLPAGLIDDSLAVAMSKAYASDRGKSLVTGTNKADARSIWFSLEKLKLFIANVESSIDTPGSNLKLGIRFYYAKYPDDISKYRGLAGLNPSVGGMHTIFMTPTYRAAGGDIDFNFEHVGNKLKPIPYAVLLDQKRYSSSGSVGAFEMRPVADPLKSGYTPRVENHGGLMPPPAGEGSFPTGN